MGCAVGLALLAASLGASGAGGERVPTLALLARDEARAATGGNLAEVLFSEMAAQSQVRLVERAALQAILDEQKLSLAGLAQGEKAVAVGKLLGADHLLFAEGTARDVAIRLVDVADGKVRLEERVALGKDPFLAAASIREKVLRALSAQPEPKDRLTVGIAAFPNRSGTDRTDKLGIRLQELLRARLRQERWATVLERQYPTGLLDEVELARLGLAKGHAENLPPADLVIFGTMEDASREYRADQPWEVKLDLSFRLGNKSTRLRRVCKSNGLEAAADEIAKAIQAFRLEAAAGRPAESEKEFWRKQGLYHMPRPSHEIGREAHFCDSERDKLDVREAIRAWENLLLLDPDDAEAKLNLGVSLVSLFQTAHFYRKGAELEGRRQALRGSWLVESAVRARPTPHNATTFYFISGTLRSVGSETPELVQRATDMFGYILANPQVFADYEVKYAGLVVSLLRKGSGFPDLSKAAAQAEKDPIAALRCFGQWRDRAREKPDEVVRALAPFCDAPSPLVRFAAERATADTLTGHKKDPAALEHYDRAIALLEKARAALGTGVDAFHQSESFDYIYREKQVASEFLGKPDAARQAVLDGARHLAALGRFGHASAWLYFDCDTQVLRAGEEKEGLEICRAYLDGADRNPYAQNDHGARMLELKVTFEARLAGTRLPDFEAMRRVKGTEGNGLRSPRMAVAGGKLWLAAQSGGPALVFDPGSESAQRLGLLSDKVHSVAAVGQRIFFGGYGGIQQLDTAGRLVKAYSKKENQLPADWIVDLCAGGGKLYLSFQDFERYGVAVLDPATDTLSVLAPTARETRLTSEPVLFVYRVWWDTVNARLFANEYLLSGAVRRPSDLGWFQTKDGWQRRLRSDGPELRCILSERDETLQVSRGAKEVIFEFLKARQTVRWPFPLPDQAGEPAWDDTRIWVPTCLGLHEIDRATGAARWLAHQDDTPCLAVLKHNGKLYVATSRGLYFCDVPR